MTTEQPTTPRAALLAFADWIENQGPIVPRPPADYAFLAREYSERYERTVAGPSCACDEISHTLDQFVADIGGVAKRVEQMAEDVMWLRLKATRDPDFEELDPVKATALANVTQLLRGDRDVTDSFVIEMAHSFEAYLRDEPTRRCGMCGCTDDHACQGGCSWVSPDLCSRCAWTPVKDGDVPARAAGGIVGGPVTFEVPFSPVAAEVIRGWTPVADGTESLREQWRAAQTAQKAACGFCGRTDDHAHPMSSLAADPSDARIITDIQPAPVTEIEVEGGIITWNDGASFTPAEAESIRRRFESVSSAKQLLTLHCARGDHDGCPVSLGVPCTCACHAKAIVP